MKFHPTEDVSHPYTRTHTHKHTRRIQPLALKTYFTNWKACFSDCSRDNREDWYFFWYFLLLKRRKNRQQPDQTDKHFGWWLMRCRLGGAWFWLVRFRTAKKKNQKTTFLGDGATRFWFFFIFYNESSSSSNEIPREAFLLVVFGRGCRSNKRGEKKKTSAIRKKKKSIYRSVEVVVLNFLHLCS